MKTEKSQLSPKKQVALPAWVFGFLVCFSATAIIALISTNVENRLQEWSQACDSRAYNFPEPARCYPRLAYGVLWSLEAGPSFPASVFTSAHQQYNSNLEVSQAKANLALEILVSSIFYGLIGAIAFQFLSRRAAFLSLLLVFFACTLLMTFFILALWEAG